MKREKVKSKESKQICDHQSKRILLFIYLKIYVLKKGSRSLCFSSSKCLWVVFFRKIMKKMFILSLFKK